MKTKIFALLVAMLALVLVLASCGGGNKNGPTADGCTHEGVITVAAKASTCKMVGTKAHWSCPECGKKFSDAGCTTEIADVSIPKVEHEFDEFRFCIYCNTPEDLIDDIIREDPVRFGEKTNLTFMITDNSNGKELGSGLRRYLAGNTENVTVPGEIDGYVAKRNGYAEEYANCKVDYTYYSDDDTTDKWGAVGTKMEQLSKSVNSPDMFSNFIYDMMNCQLLGCWQNLLNTTNYGTNHFSFTKTVYMDTGRGYMYEYMKSPSPFLSLLNSASPVAMLSIIWLETGTMRNERTRSVK